MFGSSTIPTTIVKICFPLVELFQTWCYVSTVPDKKNPQRHLVERYLTKRPFQIRHNIFQDVQTTVTHFYLFSSNHHAIVLNIKILVISDKLLIISTCLCIFSPIAFERTDVRINRHALKQTT